jgi:hypothetical protein
MPGVAAMSAVGNLYPGWVASTESPLQRPDQLTSTHSDCLTTHIEMVLASQ